MDLLYLLKVLYRKKWYIFLMTILAVGAALVFVLLKKPLFESIAQYSTGFSSEKVKLFDGSTAADLYSVDAKFNNVIETFKSPRVIGMLSYKLLLHDLENSNKPYRKLTDQLQAKPIFKAVDTREAISILRTKIIRGELLRSDDPVEKNIIEYLKLYKYDHFSLLEFMFIVRLERTDYLNIVFRSENPELSAFVVNTMGEEFLNYFKNLNSQRTVENAENIKKMADQQKMKVDSLGNLLLLVKEKQGTIDPVSKSTSAMETVKELETRLAEENSKYNEHKNRLENLNVRLRELQNSSNSSGSSNDEVIRLTNRKNDLVAELARKGGTDPDLQRQINDLRTEIILKSSNSGNRNNSKEVIQNLRNQISEEDALVRASLTTISEYQGKIRQYTGMTNVSITSSVNIDLLKDQLDIENKQLGNIKEKLNQAEGLSKDDPSVNFKQTLIGQPAVEPEPRKAIMTMILAGISMMFLTSLVFLFNAVLDSTLRNASNFGKLVNLKLVASLNLVNAKKSVQEVIMEAEKSNDPNGIFKNNIRKLRYDMAATGKKIFLFTSTATKVGKSTIVEALAYSLLLNKKKVLIIDFNLPDNQLTKRFEASVLMQDLQEKYSKTNLSGAKLTGTTAMEGLQIIGCSADTKTPSEILNNFSFEALLNEVKDKFDFILIEAAALNAYSDSKEIANDVEAVYSIFAADESITQIDKESIQFLYGLKDKNKGAVLNKIQMDHLDN